MAPAEAEGRAYQQIVREFEKIGRSAPRLDKRLSVAARAMAEEAVRTSASEASDLQAVTEKVSEAQGFDPSPRALVIRGHPLDAAVESFLARKDIADEAATHVGVAATRDGDDAALVVLTTFRKVELSPFPRTVPKVGASHPLCGEVLPPLTAADVYVTQPSGKVEKVPLSKSGRLEFCAPILFPTAGRYTVEVIGRGERGPEVGALFFTDVGPRAKQIARELAAREPTSAGPARAEVLEKINALRTANGSPLVKLDDALSKIAQAYAERMSAEGFFAHVAPDGSDLRSRLRSAGYLYGTAGENLGMAAGPLAAHFGIEQSPGHRRNLLDPVFTALGMGVVFERDNRVVLVEILANPQQISSDPLKDAYKTISDRRSSLKLPALRRSEALERIATDHARRALELDEPKSQLPGSKVHDRVFSSLDKVATAAVDFYVADAPGMLGESQNLADKKNSLVGVGTVRGDSARFGKGKYFVVVIYASTRAPESK
ncbi:MAG: CAP domain-containing protein [Myxococcaceae bacterium]